MRPLHLVLALALAVLPGCDSGSGGQDGGPSPYTLAPNTSPAPLPVASEPTWEPPTISTADLNTRLAAREPMLVADVRSQAAFDREHITGAQSVPWADIDKRKATLPKDKPIVLYCA